MKSLVRLIALVWLSASVVLPAQAAFSSLYVFGDGACSTTDNIYGGSLYYPYTWSNGRIWIQVLAQRQGLTYDSSKDSSKNFSYFGNGSPDMLTEISAFSATDASTSLFVVWVNDADFVNYMLYVYPTYGLDPTRWNNMISSSLANHQTAIQALYSKGARTLVMPNAVDITEVPQYSGMAAGQKNFIRQGVVAFNSSLATIVNQARASLPGLKIYMPNMFALLDDMSAHPANYGLVNPGYAALQSQALNPWYLNGAGASYLFWDPWGPSAKAHEVLADTVQQLISPVKISNLTWLNGSNRLDLANVPIGLNGFVDRRTNLVSGTWTSVTNVNSTSTAETIFVPASGPQQFYRLRFPFVWSWP